MHTKQLLSMALLVSTFSTNAWGICRVVEEVGSPPPIITPTQSVLLIQYSDAVIQTCPDDIADGGLADSGTFDGGFQGADAGNLDGGFQGNDGGSSDGGLDAGTDMDAGTEDPACESLRGEAITMVVRPEFALGAEGSRFALLMVTPSWPLVAVADNEIFDDLAQATGPELLIVDREIEDVSLGYQCHDPQFSSSGGCGAVTSTEGSNWQPPLPDEIDPPVDPEVETIGAYDVVRLNVDDTEELAGWLEGFDYVYSESDLLAIDPYIQQGWTVVAVQVRHDFGHRGGLTPLAFSWAGSEMRLPMGISMAPPPAESNVTVYVSADRRYDFPGGHVSYAKPSNMSGNSFLTRSNLWVDLSLGAESDPIAFEASGEVRDSLELERITRIPSSDCPQSSRDDSGLDCGCSVRKTPGVGSLLLFLLCVVALRRRRRNW